MSPDDRRFRGARRAFFFRGRLAGAAVAAAETAPAPSFAIDLLAVAAAAAGVGDTTAAVASDMLRRVGRLSPSTILWQSGQSN